MKKDDEAADLPRTPALNLAWQSPDAQDDVDAQILESGPAKTSRVDVFETDQSCSIDPLSLNHLTSLKYILVLSVSTYVQTKQLTRAPLLP